MQSKGQALRAFVLQGARRRSCWASTRRRCRATESLADLKAEDRRDGAGLVDQRDGELRARQAGIKPSEVSIVGVGAGNGAVAAMRAGQIDAISNLDPVITLLQRSGDLKIISDTRIVAEADKVFGGPIPAACLYAPQSFVDKHPATVRALANALVRADKWIQGAGAGGSSKAVPENYLLGDRAVYIDAFMAARARSRRRPVPGGRRGHGGARPAEHRPGAQGHQVRSRRGVHQRVRAQGQPEVSGRMSAPPVAERVSCTFVDRHDPGAALYRGARRHADRRRRRIRQRGRPDRLRQGTLLNVAAGLLAPSSGTVEVFGQPLAGINARAGYMFQAEA